MSMYNYLKINVMCKTDATRVNRASSYLTRWLEAQNLKNPIICLYMKQLTNKTKDKALSVWSEGFDYAGIHYVFMAAGASDSRRKSWYMIREDLHQAYMDKFMCGLTIDDINRQYKGKYVMSSLRFTNYLEMSNTSGYPIDVDLNRFVVLADEEHEITFVADYVNTETYTINPEQTITEPFNMSDGGGCFRPGTFELKAFTARAPWVKGALIEYPRWDLIPDTLVDVWGDTHNKNDIDVIMTESQFKAYKCYDSWADYVRCFKETGAEFEVCITPHIRDKQEISYQPLQTLDMTESEVDDLLKLDLDYIRDILTNPETAAKAIGLKLYAPELANSRIFLTNVREYVTNKLKKMRYGKINIKGATYYMSNVDWTRYFGHESLKAGECCCLDYPDGDILDLVRYPHSIDEHIILTNRHIPELCIPGTVCINAEDNSNLRANGDFDGDKFYVIPATSSVTAAAKRCNSIGTKYPLPESGKHKVTFDTSEYGMWTQLLQCYGDDSNIGDTANTATKIIDSDWSDDDKTQILKYLAMVMQYKIDFSKCGTPCPIHPDLQAKIREAEHLPKPLFMSLADETKNKALREDNNRAVREMTAAGIQHNKKRKTKADDIARYKQTVNPNTTMGKIWLAIDKFESELGKLENFYYTQYQCMGAPSVITDERYELLVDMGKHSNARSVSYKDRVNMMTLNDQPSTICMFNTFSFEELLDVALNHRKGDIAMAALIIKYPEEYDAYCNSASKVLYSGDKWTKQAGRKSGGDANAKPVYIISETTGYVREYDNIQSAADALGIKRPNLSKYINDNKYHKIKSMGGKYTVKSIRPLPAYKRQIQI